MHIRVKAIDISAIETVIVIAADENLLRIRKVAEPIQEVKDEDKCFPPESESDNL